MIWPPKRSVFFLQTRSLFPVLEILSCLGAVSIGLGLACDFLFKF